MNGIKYAMVAVLATIYSGAALAGPLPFGPSSMRAIEEQHAGTPFIVAVWATDCPPCRHELQLLGAFANANPQVPVVLIATDTLQHAELVNEILSQYDLTGLDSWMFAEANVERLRYTIDPDWFGEMPRSYFYDSKSNRVARSGALTEMDLQDWLESL